MHNDNVHYFEKKRIRTVWDEEKQEWFFSIIDIVEVLTETENPRRYWSDLKSRLKKNEGQLYEKIVQLRMPAEDNKMRLTDVADAEQLSQMMQYIPSQKTEQFKSWLETFGNEMIGASKENKGEMILYQPDDNSVKLDVLLENETVWLNRQQIAVLFGRDVKTVGKHINNALSEELSGYAVVANFATTATDGKTYLVEHYGLDVVLSVGYRVKSNRGIEFRIWSNKVLKEYIMKGYAVNQRFERIEERVAETEKQIGFIVRTSLPPIQGVLSEGQIFDAYVLASNIIKSAKGSIVLLDNYVDESVLLLLSKRSPGVSAEIYTKHISPQLKLDIEKHNAQYDQVYVHESDKFHDRFLIIDHTVYHMGASLKDLGKVLFAFSKMETSDRWILDNI